MIVCHFPFRLIKLLPSTFVSNSCACVLIKTNNIQRQILAIFLYLFIHYTFYNDKHYFFCKKEITAVENSLLWLASLCTPGTVVKLAVGINEASFLAEPLSAS